MDRPMLLIIKSAWLLVVSYFSSFKYLCQRPYFSAHFLTPHQRSLLGKSNLRINEGGKAWVPPYHIPRQLVCLGEGSLFHTSSEL